MPDNNRDRNQDSRTQIIVALVGLFRTVGVSLITNWDKFFPFEPSSVMPPPPVREPIASPFPSASAPLSPLVDGTVKPTWQFVGNASTGESVFVDSSSIKKSADAIDFTYRIGGEVLVARADCSGDRWYLDKYGEWYSP